MLLSVCATSTRGMRRRSESGARTAACQCKAASDSELSAIGTLSSCRAFLRVDASGDYRRRPLRIVYAARRKSVTSTKFDRLKRATLLGLRGAPAHGGGGVLLREALDQAVDAFLLHHRVELGAVGQDQAHALDRDVEDSPALLGLAHLEVDRQRLAAGAHELPAHGPFVALRPAPP